MQILGSRFRSNCAGAAGAWRGQALTSQPGGRPGRRTGNASPAWSRRNARIMRWKRTSPGRPSRSFRRFSAAISFRNLRWFFLRSARRASISKMASRVLSRRASAGTFDPAPPRSSSPLPNSAASSSSAGPPGRRFGAHIGGKRRVNHLQFNCKPAARRPECDVQGRQQQEREQCAGCVQGAAAQRNRANAGRPDLRQHLGDHREHQGAFARPRPRLAAATRSLTVQFLGRCRRVRGPRA